MSDEENEHGTDLSGQAQDAAHPFDQTNGMVDGLEGDADAPEQADRNTGADDGEGFIAAPAPGSQMVAGIVPATAGDEPGGEGRTAEDPDADDPTPA